MTKQTLEKILAEVRGKEKEKPHQVFCAKVIAMNNETPFRVKCDCQPAEVKIHNKTLKMVESLLLAEIEKIHE